MEYHIMVVDKKLFTVNKIKCMARKNLFFGPWHQKGCRILSCLDI